MFIQLPLLSSRLISFLLLSTTSVPLQQIQGGRRGQSFWALWRRAGYGPGIYPQVPREIRHVRANDEGEFDQNHHNWPSFAFYGSSVIDLKNELRLLQDWNEDMSAYTLCMRPGSHGRLMPLVTHLPRSTDPLSIVVFRTGSPGDYSASFTAVYAALVTCCALTVSACDCLKFSGSKFSSVCSSEFVMQKDQ